MSFSVVAHNNEVEDSHVSSSIPASSSLTEQMFAELRATSCMDNMPASEWAPIGNSYTISSGQASKWKTTEEDDTDDKNKPTGLSKMYKWSKAIKLVVKM